MSTVTTRMRERAESRFQKNEALAVERRKAALEYESEAVALRKRTERLRALRLAKEEMDRQSAKAAAAMSPKANTRAPKRIRNAVPK
jgi:hypothetical protein